jgi:hypothetical protein
MKARGNYRRFSAPFQRAAVNAVRNGEPIVKLADELQVPYSTLHGWCVRAGVKTDTHRFAGLLESRRVLRDYWEQRRAMSVTANHA